MAEFAVGDDVVVTKSGSEIDGKVAYFDGAYLSVSLRNGVEFDFVKPFDGVELASVVAQRRQKGKVSTTAISALPNALLALGQLTHLNAAKAIRQLGGTASAWDDLTDEQKLNFIAVGAKQAGLFEILPNQA